MEQAVVDRFEGDMAVLLVGTEQRPLDVPRTRLPEGVREGQWLQVELRGTELIRAVIDEDATKVADERIQEKLARLRRGDHLQ